MRLLHTQLLFACIIFAALPLHAQKKKGQERVDSLLGELAKQKEDSNKVKIIDKISDAYFYFDPDEGIRYGKMEVELAGRIGWKRGVALADNTLGLNYEAKSDYTSALACFLEQEKIFNELNDRRGIESAACNIGLIYDGRSDYPKALEYLSKAAKIGEERGDKGTVAIVFCNIGGIYYKQGDYPKALDASFKALKVYDELGDKDGAGNVEGNIGAIYHDKGENDKALDYYDRSLKECHATGSKAGEANAEANIGGVYFDKGDYANALAHMFRGLKMLEEMKNMDGVAFVLGNIGQTYARLRNYPLAVAYAQKAVQLNEQTGDKQQLANALFQVGDAYLSLVSDTGKPAATILAAGELPAGDIVSKVPVPEGKAARLKLALTYLTRGLDTAKQIPVPGVMKQAYEDLARAYKLTGDPARALENYQAFIALRDSDFSRENERKLLKAEVQYDYDKKRLADSLQISERNKLSALQLQRQRTYTYIGVAGVLLLLVFSVFMARNYRLLGAEKLRSDNLLLNILPEEVANELKVSGNSTARHYENVTVLFTDFVNFTQAGEKMTPQQLIDELHTCFKEFDEICVRNGIEKIKTIGDAYLAIAGLPVADSRHAEKAVQAAVEVRNFMEQRFARLGDKTFEVRIGMNSGSVVAGIVGVKKFSYDIWGDTVNTAARMEQNSEPGKINISQSTYDLVKDKFKCEYRGEIEAKNKGMLKMYFVS